ncbi:unnamed protein product [Amoebophrya sp. A25]|nr:unnamed protein product [Amoebophrya sp. A25]|eukprot:GSA25T00015264001.1
MQTGRDPVLPSYIRKEKMSALLAHEDMPLSAAMLRIPYAHRHLIVQDDELQAADLEGPPEPSPRPSSSNPDEAEVEALVQASARKSARFHSDSVSDAGKTGGQDRRSRSPAPSENKKKFKQRRRIDEVHISAYVSVDWPQCMREPDHIWKRRQRMVTQLGRTATGTISNAKLFETLMKVDGFKRPFRSASSGALLDIRSSSSSGAGQLTIKPPQMATFGGNLYLDMTQEGNLAVELFRTRRAANKTDIRENTTLGRTLFSAHSGASRIVNMSRSVNPAVMTKRPKTPLNR